MRAQVDRPQRFEFLISNNESRVLLENQSAGVVIRAARDISSREKLFLIRHLAAEGFIPERYQWFSDLEPGSYSGLIWIVDASWVKNNSGPHNKALRQILRLIICASLVWLALMSYAFLHAFR